LKVTFDSNSYRQIASPTKFHSDPDIPHFEVIRQAIVEGKIVPCLSETIFTLEAIQRKERKNFLSNYQPEIKWEENATNDGKINISFSIGPNIEAHPGSHPILNEHFNDAMDLGFKLLRLPRIAGITNPEVEGHHLELNKEELEDKLNNFGNILSDIEARGSGMQHIKEIGNKYCGENIPWQDGIKNAPDQEDKNIQNAIAEWADGDSVASHISYKNDYFCTRDMAKKAGSNSILSPANKAWLETEYGTKFVTPKELAEILETN
jgi:hypothetical protein